MLPVQQRLHLRDFTRCHINLRLILDGELFAFQGLVEAAINRQQFRSLQVHCGVVKLKGVASFGFGFIECCVCVLQLRMSGQ